MAEFLKSASKLVMTLVAIIGFLALFFNALKSPLVALISLALLLLIGVGILILYYFTKIENKIELIEQKFKRADDLVPIRADIEALKLFCLKKK